MKIILAGGTGLLGRALGRRLLQSGHTVTVLSRAARAARNGEPAAIAWTPDGTTGPWAQSLEGADAVVNLAGAGIADKRWNNPRKALLRSSRLDATRSLVGAIAGLSGRPATFLQCTAIGYYEASLDDRAVDETAPMANNFFGHLCAEWEAAAQPVEAFGCRLAVVRTGVVLDGRGGALPQMALPFKLFGGGPLASGRQVMSWIHVDDWASLVTWLLATPDAQGIYNATAPHAATNAEFARALGSALGRPSWLPVPAFVLRLVVGEMADAALITGQRVVPARALAQGFRFQYTDLGDALRSALALR